IGDLRVKRGPAEARDPALRADREAVGGWLLVARLASVDLDVVEEQRAEQLGALDTRRDVEPDETIRLGALVVLGQQAEGEDVREPGLELAVDAGNDRSLPQRECGVPWRPDREAMRDEVAMLRRSGRVGQIIELRDQSLEVHAIGPDPHVELIVTVRIR